VAAGLGSVGVLVDKCALSLCSERSKTILSGHHLADCANKQTEHDKLTVNLDISMVT
jgi:hypothetical protein